MNKKVIVLFSSGSHSDYRISGLRHIDEAEYLKAHDDCKKLEEEEKKINDERKSRTGVHMLHVVISSAELQSLGPHILHDTSPHLQLE